MQRVLVLDDDKDLRSVMSDLFLVLGADECILAASVGELDKDRERLKNFSVAVLDVNLGRDQPTGVDAYEWLRGIGYRGKVAFLTGHAASHPLVLEASNLKDAEVIQKPASLERLENLLK